MLNDRKAWEQVLCNLTDNAFFLLAENYLGAVETPFNKQDIISRLFAFFNDKNTRRNVIDNISREDAKVLTIIYYTNPSNATDIHAILGGKYSYHWVHSTVLNLQQRLLVYSEEHDKSRKLLLTPFFRDEIVKSYVGFDTVFDLVECPNPSNVLPFSDRFVFASAVFSQTENFNTKGLEKPRVLQSKNVADVLNTVNIEDFLEYTGIIYKTQGRRNINIEILAEYLSLPARMQQIILGSYIAGLKTSSLEKSSGFYGAVLDFIPQGRGLVSEQFPGAVRLLCSVMDMPEPDIEVLLSVMKGLKHVVEQEGALVLSEELVTTHENQAPARFLISANFELTITPGSIPSKAAGLAAMVEFRSFDHVLVFEFTKQSFYMGRDNGLSLRHIKQRMEDLLDKDPSMNVVSTMEAWNLEYDSIRLYRGILLEVSKDRSHLVDNSDIGQKYVCNKISDGLYLIADRDLEAVKKEFSRLGVNVLPALTQTEAGSRTYSTVNDVPRFSFRRAASPVPHEDFFPAEFSKIKEDALSADFLKKLRKAAISSELKDDLMLRIKNKLIVNDKQLQSPGSLRKNTAVSGFDFQGKLRMISQAVKTDDELLEIELCINDDIETFLFLPVELTDKMNDPKIAGKRIPEDSNLEIRVRRIISVKKLTSSLYR